MDFEGRPLPAPADLPRALRGTDRAWCVRAAVVHAPFAAEVASTCAALLADPDPAARSTALAVAHALQVRGLGVPIAHQILSDSELLYDVPDPGGRGATLAESAVAFLAEVPSPHQPVVRAALRHALGHPALAAAAWRVVGGEDPEAVLPHLGALLTSHPELAGEAGTRFALLFPTWAEAAAEAVAPLPEPTRRAFGSALEKHLLRVHAVKRWVACRRLLFGA